MHIIIGGRMIKRLKTALFVPTEIINMRVDSFGLVFVYLLLLAFIMMIPASIKVARFDKISFDDRTKIEQAFNGQNVPYTIVNNRLTNVSESLLNDYYIDDEIMVTFSLKEVDAPLKKTSYRIVFSESGVNLYYYLNGKNISSLPMFKYEEYEELHNINLAHSTSSENYDFWNDIFSVVNKEVKKYIPYVTIGVIIGYTISNLAIMLAIAVLLALVQRIMTRRIISFKENYVIASYALSPMVICGLLSELFGVRLIYMIGIILAVIYNMIASNQLLSIRR